MSKILTVAKGEFYRYFISPLAYVYLISFLVLNSSFSLYFGGIFTSGNASLKPMFTLLPWLYLIFIPGIAMRLWAEEFKSGTVLQLLTLPVSISDLVWGKFLAAWGFCTVALFLTFPFVITINFLGYPDNAVILNSYFGAFLLSGAMLAISQTASTLTKNQVIALIIAIILNLIFFLCGLEYILSIFRTFAPDDIVSLVASFSFLTHSSDFNSGLFRINSLLFLGSLIVLFNLFSCIIISFKTSGTAFWLKTKSMTSCIFAIILFLLSFTGINLLAESFLNTIHIDTTSEKLFTPSESTEFILKNLPTKTTARVYYSPILGQRDERIRESFKNLTILLKTYKSLSDGKFDFKIYNPEPLSDVEDRAIEAGLQGIPVPDLNIAGYFGISFSDGNGKTGRIPFFPLQRQKFLEQDLTETIYLLEYPKQELGLITSLPIIGYKAQNAVKQPWQITKELEKYYNITLINDPKQLQNIDILMMVHPQNLSPEMEQAIYDYSVTGKKILAFFDIATESQKFISPIFLPYNASDYGSLPNKWGFKFLSNAVVADLENSTQIAVETADYNETSQDLIQFYLKQNNFLSSLPETKGLKRILTTSASVFMPLKTADIYFVPLITASEESALFSSAVVTQRIHPSEILKRFKTDKKPKFLAAHILSKSKEHPFELIVVGDTDLLYDSFWTSSISIGDTHYNIPLLDSANFVLNALDSLSRNQTLISLRGKSPLPRPFSKIEKQRKEQIVAFKIKEKEIFDEINQVKSELNELENKKYFEERTSFTPDELSLISKMKKNLLEKRHDLFLIRKNLNAYMEKLDLLVKILNIYTIPGFLIFILLLCKIRKLHIKKIVFSWNKNLSILTIVACSLILLGIASSLYSHSESPSFQKENLPLFPELEKQINNITEISIKTNKKALTFIKKDIIWTLKEHPSLIVNQKRIQNFLSSLLQGTFYEEKSDKIETLASFELLPLENEKSTATKITLSTQSETILEFDVGKYNIDLSRGALGAYIRFPNKFKTWLAQIELLDLDLDYHNWCYANLWSLDFGRFSKSNKTPDTDSLAKLMSIFLNTPLTERPIKTGISKILSIEINGEYFNKLTLTFYQKDLEFYVTYSFDKVKSEILNQFVETTKNQYFEISKTDMEKIKNAISK